MFGCEHFWKLDFLYIKRINNDEVRVTYRTTLRSFTFVTDKNDLYDIIRKIYCLEDNFYDKLYPNYVDYYDDSY